ncbi:MAG: hypothetical protein V4808_14410 [Pseudomonadota bacterium]
MRAPLDSFGLPPIAFSAAVALLFAALSWPLYGIDVQNYLLPWFGHIRATGPVAAFAEPFGNYSPPYLYLMAAVSPLAGLIEAPALLKLLSFAGHLVLVAAAARLLRTLGHAHPWRAAACIGLAPSLFVNPAILVQCDALWAAALLVALTAAIDRRHAAMFGWCGLAFAIKLQAGFAAPFFLALALARHVPLRLWLFAPLMAFATLVPAWAMGWPLADLLGIYLRQSQFDITQPLNAPNIWTILAVLPAGGLLVGMAAPAAAAAALGYVALFRQRLAEADPVVLIRAALLCALIVPGLLPRMHERYFFLSDLLALLLVLCRPAEWRVALFTQLGSCFAIFAYLSGISGFASIGGAMMLVATWLLVREIGFRPAERYLAVRR